MYVGVTGYTISCVQTRIRRMHQLEAAEVVAPTPPSPPLDAVDELWLRKKLWSPPEQLLEPGVLGHELLSVQRPLPVTFRYVEIVDEVRHEHRILMDVTRLPRHQLVDENGNVRTYGPKATVDIEPSDHPFFGAAIAHTREQREMKERWTKIERDVVNFLNACKSVNHALKVWPDVRRYLEADVLEKVEKKLGPREKVDSDPAAEKLKTMDLDTIAASTVIARMAEADAKK